METIEKISDALNRWAGIIAGTILVFMILLTMGNIVLRRIWVPILGTYEIMGFAGAVTTALRDVYGMDHLITELGVAAPKAPARRARR